MIDSIYIPVAILILIISVLVAASLISNISNALSFIPFFQNIKNFQDALAYFLVGVYFGLPIASAVLSFQTGAHPGLLILLIPLLLISGIISLVVRDTVVQVVNSDASFGNFISNYSFLAPLISYFPLIMTLFSALIIILQFV